VKCSIQKFLPEGHDWKGNAAFGCIPVTTEKQLRSAACQMITSILKHLH
jgi:hypothetical protein